MSYKLKYTGEQIDNILDRAVEGGTIDDALALKAPLESPALTGTPTAPTQAEGDESTKVATTAYADRAADAAEAAAKEYTDRAASALYITDTASGSIASFSDGADGVSMRSVKASIEPVQNLNGQDAPYPPGGGKNKLPTTLANIKAINTGGTWSGNTYVYKGVAFNVLLDDGGNIVGVTASGTATDSANLFIVMHSSGTVFTPPAGEYIVNGCPSGGDNSSYAVRLQHKQGGSTVTYGSDFGSGYSATIGSGDIVQCVVSIVRNYSISGTLTFKPMLRLATETDATFAPYSNICPIDGWTGANINVTAVNIYDQQWESGSINAATGELVSNTSAIRSKNRIPVYPSTSYRFLYTDGATNVVGIHAYDADDNWLGMYDPGSNVWKTTGGSIGYITNHPVFTTPANTAFIRFMVGGKTTYTEGQISINTPSTVTGYMPFGTTYPVTWETQAGTVYGGTIDVVSGELTVTHIGADMGALTWSYESSQMRFKSTDLSGLTDGTDAICSMYARGASFNALADGQFIIGGTGNLFVKDSRYTDSDSFKAAVTGQTVLYPLLTAQSVQLSAQQITSLLGQNNVWSNTGDTEVEYVADPKLYIAKMLGGGALTLGSASPLSLNRPVTINEEDLEQAGEVSEAVEAAAETVLPAESGETEEGAQE